MGMQFEKIWAFWGKFKRILTDRTRLGTGGGQLPLSKIATTLQSRQCHQVFTA